MANVYSEIMEWSQGIPLWQRDALRRIAQGTISDADTAELAELCLTECGLGIEKAEHPSAKPLQEEHLPLDAQKGVRVALTSIRAVRNVNLLDPDSELTLAPNGLTVVYGDNGSGKSGYTRILKKLCRARDTGTTIYPNVFEEPTGEPATATISYCRDMESIPECTWIDGKDFPSDLARVCVFDSYCAEFYVTKNNEVAYRPFGLDMFDRLADAADAVRSLLEQRKASLPSRCPQPPPSLRQSIEPLGVFPVTEETDLEDIRKSAVLDGCDAEELRALRRAVDEDSPDKRASAVRARKSLLDGLRSAIDSALIELSQDACNTIKERLASRRRAEDEERALSDGIFGRCLAGTGTDTWKVLWNAAQHFSEEHAYAGAGFPYVEDGARCVLCQQPLSMQAAELLGTFTSYVKTKSAEQVKECQEAIQEHRSKLETLSIRKIEDGVYAELLAHSQELADGISSFAQTAMCAGDQILDAIDSGRWDSITLPTYDIGPLSSAIDSLANEIQLLTAEQGSDQFRIAQTRSAGLEARAWANRNLPSLEKEHARVQHVAAIDKAIRTTDTSRISRKAGELTKLHVSEDLEKKLKAELSDLTANRLRITISRKSEKGVTSHRVGIEDAKIRDCSVKEIVSEGEFRAIALAAFLAELGQSPDSSAIVVDDPVCSMDHLNRDRVARRLVKEAHNRQVVVLTHDLVFLHDLISAAKPQEIETVVCQVERRSGSAGVVADGFPWHGKSVSARTGELRNDLKRLRQLSTDTDPAYECSVREWYGRLRSTWERTVEELMLNKVVLRFSKAVQTQRLKHVLDLEERDYQILETAMARASTWISGHDQPAPVNAPVPGPDELESDLRQLEEYMEELRKRKRG